MAGATGTALVLSISVTPPSLLLRKKVPSFSSFQQTCESTTRPFHPLSPPSIPNAFIVLAKKALSRSKISKITSHVLEHGIVPPHFPLQFSQHHVKDPAAVMERASPFSSTTSTSSTSSPMLQMRGGCIVKGGTSLAWKRS